MPSGFIEESISRLSSLFPTTEESLSPFIHAVISLLEDHLHSADVERILDDVFKSFSSSVSNDMFERVLVEMISVLSSRNFNTIMNKMLVNLSSLYDRWNRFGEAADMMSKIDMHDCPNNVKAQYLITTALYYLMDGDPVNAETYNNRASEYVKDLGETVEDRLAMLRYMTNFARIQDSNAKFYGAAVSYHKLLSHLVLDHEKDEALQKSIICAILSEAGPRRSRLLSILYKEERTSRLVLSEFLCKVYFQRILTPEDCSLFEAHLSIHHHAIGADGFSHYQRAIIEHNLVAVSNLYSNISIEKLGRLLNIDAFKAEKIAAKMIAQERLHASIDQIDNILSFDLDRDPVSSWNREIFGLCSDLNGIVEDLRQAIGAV